MTHKQKAAFVPEYKKTFTAERQQKYAVVIPVINEGQRILNLLSKMKDAAIHKVADIVIVDGGSTDGSLETENLKELQVHSLLVKTASGKLSAQLLCGYSFCLEAGYEGIITIDGNDKDDPVYIRDFIKALDDGVDFVQASRYVAGGIQENTPVSRDLAIRFIHAPFLRFASGFHWTDTTQGFRAYSRKMLLDQRMSIFRDVFQEYELLAYLSYRAPKLGFKCVELPTSRIYPEGEVPTKISSFKGNLKLVQTLLTACLGGYNP